MADLVTRFDSNPLITPQDLEPGCEGMIVECVLNPGAFQFDGKTWLLMRVVERPEQRDGKISTPVIEDGKIVIVEHDLDDPDLELEDTRGFKYKGKPHLTTMSHLRLASSDDGVNFDIQKTPFILGDDDLESFGVEDCRVSKIDDKWYLTYTAVSSDGYGISMISTSDWKEIIRHGMIIPPANKDFGLFEEKVNGEYVAMHRPSPLYLGGSNIWLSRSPDLLHWGHHECIARVRPGMWDSARIGAGASPLKTSKGWLEIYHGADENSRYCLGAMLFDLDDPSKVIARSNEPIMEPTEEYERKGFFGNCVFTNGHVVTGDEITIYYGASDSVICGATISITEILEFLE